MAYLISGAALLVAMLALFFANEAMKKAEAKSSELVDAQIKSLKDQVTQMGQTARGLESEQRTMGNKVDGAVARATEAVDTLLEDVRELHENLDNLEKSILPTARRSTNKVT